MWVKQVDEALGKLERIHTQQYTLSPHQAAAIGQLIQESGIINLPDDDHIKGWQKGLDGMEIIIQSIDHNTYRFQSYWTPSAQDSLVEARLVQTFYDKAFELSNANLVRRNFETDIPFHCYSTDGAFVACKILSNTEYWQCKREVDRYLRRLKKDN